MYQFIVWNITIKVKKNQLIRHLWVSERGKLKKRKVELGKTDEETFATKIKSGLSVDDYIAWADDSYSEGMKTTTEYQTETDGDANAS